MINRNHRSPHRFCVTEIDIEAVLKNLIVETAALRQESDHPESLWYFTLVESSLVELLERRRTERINDAGTHLGTNSTGILQEHS